MQESSSTEHLTNTIDGYGRATDDHERRLFLRAALRGLATMAGGMHAALVALAAAVTKESTL